MFQICKVGISNFLVFSPEKSTCYFFRVKAIAQHDQCLREQTFKKTIKRKDFIPTM